MTSAENIYGRPKYRTLANIKEDREMKKSLILVAVLSLTFVACDAFKDSYDQVNAPEGSVTVPTSPSEGAPIGGFDNDKTVCEAVEGITVTVAEEPGAVTSTVVNSVEDASALKTVATKIADYTTKISIFNADKEILSIVIKNTAEKEYSVCSVTAADEKIASGSITIDKFNDGEMKVNSGSFNFAIASELAEDGAIKTMQDMSEVTKAMTLEGTYFVEGLTEEAVPEATEEKK